MSALDEKRSVQEEGVRSEGEAPPRARSNKDTVMSNIAGAAAFRPSRNRRNHPATTADHLSHQLGG
jgi:hypothetical protein